MKKLMITVAAVAIAEADSAVPAIKADSRTDSERLKYFFISMLLYI